MIPECTTNKIDLQGLGKRSVDLKFDGGRITSDAGALLLRETDNVFQVADKFADCFTDFRDQSKVELNYVFGLSRNQRLQRAVAVEMEEARKLHEKTGLPARIYRDFGYKTLKSWSRTRRVVGKAEYLAKGANHRFVVTNILRRRKAGRDLYEKTYCGRGDMENRIKEHQTQLFSTRTSTHRMESNQLRLWWSSVSYMLMNLLREYGLKDTELECVCVNDSQ